MRRSSFAEARAELLAFLKTLPDLENPKPKKKEV